MLTVENWRSSRIAGAHRAARARWAAAKRHARASGGGYAGDVVVYPSARRQPALGHQNNVSARRISSAMPWRRRHHGAVANIAARDAKPATGGSIIARELAPAGGVGKQSKHAKSPLRESPWRLGRCGPAHGGKQRQASPIRHFLARVAQPAPAGGHRAGDARRTLRLDKISCRNRAEASQSPQSISSRPLLNNNKP